MEEPWYKVHSDDFLETPSLLFYPDRIISNIEEMIRMVEDVSRLRPHVKTHKTAEIIQLHIERGIQKYKCATIAEAEMLGLCGANDVLLAYQPVGANISRFVELMRLYPETSYSCLCDNETIASELSLAGIKNGITIDVFVDIDDGMERTGIAPDSGAFELCRELTELEGVNFRGLHVYDGHLRDQSIETRRKRIIEDFKAVYELIGELSGAGIDVESVVAGGSPTFPVHAKNADVEASPGTTILWDKGYGTSLEGLEGFQYAAVIATRVISKPGKDRLCFDMGHKAISAEHQKPPLIYGLENFELVGHSEEHMVLEVEGSSGIDVGTVFYAVPHHICPTVALHEYALVVRDHEVVDQWDIVSRKRKLTV